MSAAVCAEPTTDVGGPPPLRLPCLQEFAVNPDLKISRAWIYGQTCSSQIAAEPHKAFQERHSLIQPKFDRVDDSFLGSKRALIDQRSLQKSRARPTQRKPIDDETSISADLYNSMLRLGNKARERNQHKREYRHDGTVLVNTDVVDRPHHSPLSTQRAGLSCAVEAACAWQMAVETLHGVQASSYHDQSVVAMA